MRIQGVPSPDWRQAEVWFEDDTGITVVTPPVRNLPADTHMLLQADKEAVLRAAIRDTCSAYGYRRDVTFEEFAAGTRRGFMAAVEKAPAEDGQPTSVSLPDVLEEAARICPVPLFDADLDAGHGANRADEDGR